MRYFILILTIMVCALKVDAQTYLDHLQATQPGKGKVAVYQSADISELVNGKKPTVAPVKKAEPATKKTEANAAKKNVASNETKPAVKKTPTEADDVHDNAPVDTSKKVMRGAYKITGYRVQVYAGGNKATDKTKAETTGNNIKSIFPDQPVYVHFYSPRWICRMGNYRTLEEAQHMLNLVKEAGYKQASIVKGKITVTD